MQIPLKDLDVDLDRDVFLRTLVRNLAGTLESMVGLDEAVGYISVVGRAMGRQYDAEFRRAMGLEQLDVQQVAEVLVELKRRIEGGFRIVDVDASRIVLANSRCPFGEYVKDRPSMCMMTSNVFGTIAAENLGYARVEIERAIADGDRECLVTVHLQPGAEAGESPGRTYFRSDR